MSLSTEGIEKFDPGTGLHKPHTHTHIYIVCTVEQSSNMRKTLKQKIFETVSTLRTLFAKLKDSGNRKTSEIN